MPSGLHAKILLKIDKASFKPIYQKGQYFLKTSGGNKIPMLKHWLTPPDQLEDEEKSYVTPSIYDSEIHSFPISEEKVGLHLSSYTIQKGGSAQAAAGKDLFFIFDTKRMILTPGKLNLDITKRRVRSMGCFWATFSNFYLYDINNDGFTDLGIIAEKIWCEQENAPGDDMESFSGPYYQKQEMKWYIFQSTRWQHDTKFNQNTPGDLIKLPLIGLSKSPIEFLQERLGSHITYK